MRDRRFVAVHRGGPLEAGQHRRLAVWAAACAEHVLALFETCSTDQRPRTAIATAKAWARGEVPVGAAQKAAVQAHAAAREMTNQAAIAAARAAGHAVATAHMADHSLGAVIYALKAVAATGSSTDAERAWQDAQIPDDLKALVISALEKRLPKALQRTNPSRGKRAVMEKSKRTGKYSLTVTKTAKSGTGLTVSHRSHLLIK